MAGFEDLAPVDGRYLDERAVAQKVKVGRKAVFAAPRAWVAVPVYIQVAHFRVICVMLSWVAAQLEQVVGSGDGGGGEGYGARAREIAVIRWDVAMERLPVMGVFN